MKNDNTMREAFEKFVADFSECEIELVSAKREGDIYATLELSKSYIIWKAAHANILEKLSSEAMVGAVGVAINHNIRPFDLASRTEETAKAAIQAVMEAL